MNHWSCRQQELVLLAVVALLAAGCAAVADGGQSGSGGLVGVGGVGAGIGGAAGYAGMAGFGGTGGTGGMTVTTPPGSTPIPCNVQQAASTCQGCHASQPIGGAPMPLITHEHFARTDYVVQFTEGMIGQTVKVADLARIRLNDADKPMPPSGQMEQAERASLDGWLLGGAPAGTEADRTCNVTPPVDPPPPSPGGGLVGRPELGEVCYDLRIHGGNTETDTTKYNVVAGEHYAEWYYNVPWKAGDVASRFGANFDNAAVLHHWLLYTDKSGAPAGSHRTVDGRTNNAQLLAGWASGGENVELPNDVGLELPAPGTMIQVQWHFYNSSGQPQPDGTVVQVCTVPAGSRTHTASLTWLGTENFNGPLGMGPGRQEFGGNCRNDSLGDITIVVFWPHMHRLGRNMRSTIDGVEIFSQPFRNDFQIVYNQTPPVVLKPNQSILSTCTYQNDTGRNVAFGSSTDQEMCYQFAFAYPAHALDNGAQGLNGASNNCW